MPTLQLPRSAHAPGISPVTIHYREFGRGKPLVILHGGWGYGIYPFDQQIAAFENQFRILIPDRSGYGRSTRVTGEMPLDFHRRAALETFSFLDALGIENAILWGHSDGAVIAAMMGLAAPERCSSAVLEAFQTTCASCSPRITEKQTGQRCCAAIAEPGFESQTASSGRTKIFTMGGWVSSGCRRYFCTAASILAPNPARWSACGRRSRKQRCDSSPTASTARTARKMPGKNPTRV